MAGINGRRKGAKAERVAAKVIEKWTGKGFSKTPASGGLGWKKANVAGDIVCTTEGHYCPFCFEVKSYAKIDFSHLLNPKIKEPEIITYWKQASRDAKKVNKIPMLMMRYNGLPKSFYFVAIPMEFSTRLVNEPNLALACKFDKTMISIVPSTEFFQMPYKEVRKIAKIYIHESKRK